MFELARFSAFVRVLVICMAIAIGGCETETDDVVGSSASEQKFKWKLVTAWPPNLPVIHEVVEKFAQDVERMTRGQMTIQVYAGGELIPALEVFDAVSDGKTVQMGHSAAYYWAGKVPALEGPAQAVRLLKPQAGLTHRLGRRLCLA